MFSTIGYFDKIPCPLEDECTLPSCIFLHSAHLARRIAVEASDEQLPSKKRKIGNEASPPQKPASAESRSSVRKQPKPFFGALLKDVGTPEPNEANNNSKEPHGTKNLLQEPISPPQSQHGGAKTKTNGQKAPGQISKPPQRETLNPRSVANAPVEHSTRILYVKKLHEFMKPLNDKIKNYADQETKALALDGSQLVLLALDEEEKIARDEKSLYANVIKLRMVRLKKMSLEDWKLFLLEKRIKDEDPERKVQEPPKSIERPIETGLTEGQERKILRHLLARQDGLEAYGYVTSPPSDEDVAKAKEGVDASGGWEKCERCASHFPVFPNRRLEDGALTDNGPCQYHHGRLQYPTLDNLEKKAQHAYGQPLERSYTCCRQEMGSLGCVEAESHVFKVYDRNRLASQLQFECTPDNPKIGVDSAVSFDCEMCFTVCGMELVRLTALSWPHGEKLLDVLVRPLGAILDLNSRYSGIHPEDYIHALPYDHDSKSNEDQNAEAQNGSANKGTSGMASRLRIVDSPKVARQLLFDFLTPSTPLIGHAIENDLSSVRIVHPCIVDTVLLYPQGSGLPFRRGLKSLTKHYLWRDIQMAGAQGHDSTEDAKATGDLVREKVKRKWWEMKRSGWTLSEDGKIVPPLIPTSVPDRVPSGPHAPQEVRKEVEAVVGQKRHHDDVQTANVDMNYD